jgi:DNA-binding protein HU-beta
MPNDQRPKFSRNPYKLVYDVFISHASADNEVAKKIADELQTHGLKIWIAERNLKSSEPIGDQIHDAIYRSRMCVVLLSHAAVPTQSLVAREWSTIQECAWRRLDLSVYTIQIENVDIPIFLRKWKVLNLRKSSTGIKDAIEEIAYLARHGLKTRTSAPSGRDISETTNRFTDIWATLTKADDKYDNPKMTKARLIASMAESANIGKVVAEKALNSFIAAVEKTLKKGDKLALTGFGTFSVSHRNVRMGRNPQTGEQIKIKAVKIPKFTAGKALKEVVGGKKK